MSAKGELIQLIAEKETPSELIEIYEDARWLALSEDDTHELGQQLGMKYFALGGEDL